MEHFWFLWSLYWCPAGWCANLFPLKHVSTCGLSTKGGYTSDLDSGVVTHPRSSSHYPVKTIYDLDFADDIALFEFLGHKPRLVQLQQQDLGLIISVPKTEYMRANCHPYPTLQVYGEFINHVTHFRYLGASNFYIKTQGINLQCFLETEALVWKFPIVNLYIVSLSYTTCMIFLHGCGSWVISHNMESKIDAFATSCYRIMLNIKWAHHVTNTVIYSMTNTKALIHCLFGNAHLPWAHPLSPWRKACQ